MRTFGAFISLAIFIMLQGCAFPPDDNHKGKRYFWPPSADDAKIEYLGFYASEANLKGALFNSVAEVVFGVGLAQPLFNRPYAVDVYNQKILVSDAGSRSVFLLDLKRKNSETKPLKTDGAFGFPAGVAFLGDDEYLVSDSIARRVVRYSLDGQLLAFIGENMLVRPTAVAVDRHRNRIVVVDTGAHKLAIFGFDGTFQGFLGERGNRPGEFNYPVDAEFDGDGNLFVLDSLNFRVQRFDRDGTSYRYVLHYGETGSVEGSFVRPKGLAVSRSGHVYVTDGLAHKVVIFDREGRFLYNFGGKFVATDGKLAPGGLYMPTGIAVDELDGIWVVDTLNRMIHHFQYLNDTYLRAHPILPGQVAPTPMELR